MDKSKKELRVTIPVRPPKVVTEKEIIGQEEFRESFGRSSPEGKVSEPETEAKEVEEGQDVKLSGKAGEAAARARIDALKAAKAAQVISPYFRNTELRVLTMCLNRTD